MSATSIRRADVESFVEDWHYNEASKQNALEAGSLMLLFLAHLADQGLSEKTLRTHRENGYFIGSFTCGYDIPKGEAFHPDLFASGEWHTYRYEYKVSDSEYAVRAFTATCRKLKKFIEGKQFEPAWQELMTRLEILEA